METILCFQTTMNIWPSGSQHKTPHAPKCHYLFRKFIGLLIIDHLIKGKLVRWGDECLFTSGPLVSGWFGQRDREASVRRALPVWFYLTRAAGRSSPGSTEELWWRSRIRPWLWRWYRQEADGRNATESNIRQHLSRLRVVTFDVEQTAINDVFI